MNEHNVLRESFKQELTKPIAWRKEQLTKLLSMLQNNLTPIYDALSLDFLRPKYEAHCEIMPIIEEIKYTLANLDSWASPTKISPGLLNYLNSLYTLPEPYGVVLIIGPFNYPFILTLKPLIGAIAAGNCCVVKPSEISVHSCQLLTNLLNTHLDSRCVRTVSGDAHFSEQLLQCKWDYIFFTGGSVVGRLVYMAGAAQLTPVTLELGGKSPVYVDEHCDLELAVKRILWAKLMNCGQTCVAPDYVLCHNSVLNKVVSLIESTMGQFFPEVSSAEFKSSCRIVNERHFLRIRDILEDCLPYVVYGGQSELESLKIAFTLILNPPEDSKVLKEEIFGPLLPILGVDSPQDAVNYISAREKPLALYVFCCDQNIVSEFKAKTSSGSLVVNDCLMQLSAKELPFGGVGQSGIGKYFGKSSFDTFSHQKSIYEGGKLLNYFENSFRYFPYTPKKTETLNMLYDFLTGIRPLPPLSFFQK